MLTGEDTKNKDPFRSVQEWYSSRRAPQHKFGDQYAPKLNKMMKDFVHPRD